MEIYPKLARNTLKSIQEMPTSHTRKNVKMVRNKDEK